MIEKPIKELTITRAFDAPASIVWKAWTDQNLVKKWWGPMGVTNPTCIWEAKPNGRINIIMEAGKELSPLAGQKWPMNGSFKEVTPKNKLVFTSNAIDEKQEALIESIVTVNFKELEGKTNMNLHVVVTKAVEGKTKEMLEGMNAGWNQQVDKLAELAESLR